jgi:hypothetical protein
LVERNLRRQTHHGDLTRRIAGLDLNFFAASVAAHRGLGLGSAVTN